MRISKFKTVLGLASVLCVLHAAQADEFVGPQQDIDWNDQVTQEMLLENGIIPVNDADVADILAQEAVVQSERLSRSGVKVLKFTKHMPNVPGAAGGGGTEYWQLMEVKNPDGSTSKFVRQMSPEEVRELEVGAAGMSRDAIADEMDVMAEGFVLTGAALRDGIRSAGFGELLGDENRIVDAIADGQGKSLCHHYFGNMENVASDPDSNDKSSAAGNMKMKGMIGPDGRIYPMFYVMGPACMLAATAEELDRVPNPITPERYAQAQAATREAINKVAKLVGDEVVDGHRTKHIVVDEISMKETLDDGSEVTINEMSIWLDPEYYVRRKFRMEGVIKRGGKTEPFFMERENQDYRRVGVTYLYEPYREVMKVGGIMSDKDRRELAKARKELQSAKQQLAQMPASQRAMMESMFASQMAQLESLVNDGAATVEVVTTDIEINPGFADTMITTLGGSAHSATLIRLIQTDLAKLGFEPGPATGKINAETSRAISLYQASRNMPVNGAPSPELATALAAEVGAL